MHVLGAQRANHVLPRLLTSHSNKRKKKQIKNGISVLTREAKDNHICIIAASRKQQPSQQELLPWETKLSVPLNKTRKIIDSLLCGLLTLEVTQRVIMETQILLKTLKNLTSYWSLHLHFIWAVSNVRKSK